MKKIKYTNVTMFVPTAHQRKTFVFGQKRDKIKKNKENLKFQENVYRCNLISAKKLLAKNLNNIIACMIPESKAFINYYIVQWTQCYKYKFNAVKAHARILAHAIINTQAHNRGE